MTVSESSARYAGWPVAVASAVGVFFASIIVVTFPVLLKPWAAEFGWSRQAISTAFAAAAVSAAICAVPLGALLDRVGPRRVAIPSLFLVGCLIASLVWLGPRLGSLIAVYALLGVFGVGTSPVAYGRVIVQWFQTRRGLALALVITGGALGGIVHPPLMSSLIHAIGWRAACLVLGAAVVAIGVPVAWLFLRERPREAAPPSLADASLADGLRSRVFWALFVVQLFGTMVQNSVIVHLPSLLTDRGVSAERGATALATMAVTAVAGRLATGFLIDRVFAARVLVVMMALAATGAYWLSKASSFGAGAAAAMLVGFATGGEADIVPYLVSRYFGLRSFSALFGLAWAANAIGGAVGPILMGRTFDTTGTYEPMLVRLALVSVGAAALALFLPRYVARASAPAVAAVSAGPG